MPTTYTPLATQTTSGSPSSVTFSSIPATYTDLVLVVSARDSRSGVLSDSLTVQFNGDTGSNYSNTDLAGNGTTASSTRSTSQTVMRIGDVAAGTSSEFGVSIVHIMNYANTTTYKTAIGRGSVANEYVEARVGLWRSTAAINSITILAQGGSATWVDGSTFSLYGVASAAVVSGAKATGGDVVATDGTYWYHAFRSSGVFTPTQALTADVLVVAGGGGSSGNFLTGGGGAGGLLAHTSQSLTATNYTITTGAGGTGLADGSNSQFGALTAAVGGGYGASGNGRTGGSGAGAGGVNTTLRSGGAGTAGQGNAGGANSTGGLAAGGGGGAGAAGSAGSGSAGGAGGAGSSTYSSWGLATGTGQNVSGTYYYAGGGGGGDDVGSGSTSGGTGGNGGGGAGAGGYPSTGYAGTNGTANTGGGGGGSSDYSSTPATNSNGGSGIVIVRYAV